MENKEQIEQEPTTEPTGQEAIEEVPVEQPEQLPESTEAEGQPAARATSPEPVETSAAENFKRLREKSERTERERDEAIRLLREINDKQQAQARAQEKSDISDEDFTINPDELAEGKHLTKIQKKIKRLEDQVKGYQSQSEQLSIESRIKSQYADFDKIVNDDTIKVLREQYPEMADTISSSPNLYNKAVTAYTLIKKMNIVPDTAYDADRALAQKNSAKPRSLTSLSPQQGDSPLSKANAFANGLTDELKVQLRKEMAEARKNS